MSIRSGLIFALASVALLSACQPAADEEGGIVKRSVITLTPVAPGNRIVTIGGTVQVNVTAKTIEGSVTTPAAAGTVTLAVAGPGSVDSDSLTLDASGSATFTFTACSRGDAGCEANAIATVTAAITIDGAKVDGNIVLTLKAGADEQLECGACGAGCRGSLCTLEGKPGVCGDTVCEVETNDPVVESNDDVVMEAGLFNAYGDPVNPARIAINSLEPMEVRVTLKSVDDGAPKKGVEVVVSTTGGDGLIGLSKQSAAADRATRVKGVTGTKGVFSAFVFAGSVQAQGSIVVEADGLIRRFTLDTVRAGILGFTPGADDNFARIMGVAESGYREQNTMRFRIFDTNGQPFVGGATINFEIIGNPGGVTLFPASARTDANSEVTVNLRSGPIAGTVLVRASAVVDNDPTAKPTTVSDSVAIVGAKVSGRNIAVSCERKAVPALMDNDCSFMRVDENTLCTAVLGDRYNNAIGRSMSVVWSTEAGLFGPPSTTEGANPDVEPASQANLGRTANTLRTLNARMPMDVPPLPGEVSRVGSAGECATRDGGIRTFNPRDGLVTFIIHTKGEEGFWDRNNNGVYDVGEEFIDVGEPFVDANDNGVWDVGEEFIDTNDNGVYDGANGVWDADTTIWATGHILYTNHASRSDVKWTPANHDPTVLATVESTERLSLSVNWKDENLNAPASSFSTYAVTLVPPMLGEIAVQSLAANIADTYGFSVTQDTICMPANNGACTLKPKLAGLDQIDGFTVSALYKAPLTEVETFDTLQATAAVRARDGSAVTVADARRVHVKAWVSDETGDNGDDGETNDEFRMVTNLFNMYGEPLNPARIAINSLEPVEVRVSLLSVSNNAPVKDKEVVVTATDGIGLLGLAKDSVLADRAATVTGMTGDNGVFRAFMFAGSVLAKGGIVVQSDDLIRRFALETVKAGILTFAPGDTDGFVRIMGVSQSGYREQNTLRFRLFDTSGRPFVGGASVSFEIIGNPGGVTLFPATARADANGEVTVNLLSGPVAGTVLVRATATVDNDAAANPTTVSDSVAIVGAKVSGRNIAVSCERKAVPALVDNDCSFMRADESTLCTAVLGDRYNNAIGRSVSVFWSTEAGLFGPPSMTENANPDIEPIFQGSLGRTANTLRTFNARMPVDVEPLAGEVSRVGSPEECEARDGGIRTFNPRDGLVTFIVHTKGEEGFWDRNNNGVYDVGEEFIDVGEPFIDANDSGVWEPGEEFVDTNNNGVYDGPNGIWDADTTIWATGHILYTNHASLSAVTWTPQSAVDPELLATVEAGERLKLSVNWKDENLNQTAASFSSYDVSIVKPWMGDLEVQSLVENIADTFGFGVTQQTTCLNTGVCRVATKLAGLDKVNGFTVKALYTAPSSPVDTYDLVQATASVRNRDYSSVTVIDERAVDVLAAVPVGP